MREIRRHTRTQSQFLRLRRTKIGLQDFRTVKVIGKGAFGEVSIRCLILLPDNFFFSIPRVPSLGGEYVLFSLFGSSVQIVTTNRFCPWSIFRRPLRVSLLG